VAPIRKERWRFLFGQRSGSSRLTRGDDRAFECALDAAFAALGRGIEAKQVDAKALAVSEGRIVGRYDLATQPSFHHTPGIAGLTRVECGLAMAANIRHAGDATYNLQTCTGPNEIPGMEAAVEAVLLEGGDQLPDSDRSIERIACDSAGCLRITGGDG
jgi:hypothetical protein